MPIFDEQRRAAEKSFLFFAAFFPALIISMAGVCLFVSLILSFPEILERICGRPADIFSLKKFLPIFLTGSLFVLAVSIWKILAIRSGGGVYMAQTMGGVLLDEAQGPAERRLLNVVEEMAVASGLPRPLVFILPLEPSINAVTVGLNYDDAVIIVTRGALSVLSRDELQAVTAHEFAHILNDDFSWGLFMAGWLYGLVFLSVCGRRLTAYARSIPLERSSRTIVKCVIGTWYVLAYLAGGALRAAGGLCLPAAEAVEAAFSRQRETLADAFAVQFTRNPAALAGALKKIAAQGSRAYMDSRSASALCLKSFFIAEPVRGSGLFKTHPPIEDRIFALEPNWNGRLDSPGPQKPAPVPPRPAEPKAAPAAAAAPGGAPRADLAPAQTLLSSMPPELKQAAEDSPPALASALMLTLCPLKTEAGRIVEHFLGPPTAERARGLCALMNGNFFTPLLNLSAPGLRRLDSAARRSLVRMINALESHLDSGLMGPAVSAALKRQLKCGDRTAAPGKTEIQDAAAIVIQHLAEIGALGAVSRRGAAQAGRQAFHSGRGGGEAKAEGLDSDRARVIKSLEILAAAEAPTRQNLISAAVATASYDRIITAAEYEILRALAVALMTPLPMRPQ